MRMRLAFLIALVFLALTLPYLLANQLAGSQFVFNGFLLNPVDGYTYLAKMRQGYDGNWLSRLAFSAEPGEGAPLLFILYPMLGHAARVSGLPLVVVFHLARLFSAGLLLWSLWGLVQRYAAGYEAAAPDRRFPRLWTFTLLSLGLGMGWLALPFGELLSDSWVAEAYPFLSMFTTPHFALGLALMVIILSLPLEALTPWRFIAAGGLSALLGLIQPFGVVACLVALGGWFGLEWLAAGRQVGRWTVKAWLSRFTWPGRLFWYSVCVGLGGVPWLLYEQAVVVRHPQFSIWNAQNLTLTPAAWDVALALSPALILAAWGAWDSFKHSRPPFRLAVAWLVVGLALIYAPFSLQRRFMTGLYIPAVLLAGHALGGWQMSRPRLFTRLKPAVIALALPTTLIVLALGLFGALTHEPIYYLTTEEAHAMQWIEHNTPPHALILAAPQTGLLIPALTGRRVIYGHPFETIHSQQEQAAVERFFAWANAPENPPDDAPELTPGDNENLAQARQFLQQRQVDYIFYGPRERLLGKLSPGLGLRPVFSSGAVTVYQP